MAYKSTLQAPIHCALYAYHTPQPFTHVVPHHAPPDFPPGLPLLCGALGTSERFSEHHGPSYTNDKIAPRNFPNATIGLLTREVSSFNNPMPLLKTRPSIMEKSPGRALISRSLAILLVACSGLHAASGAAFNPSMRAVCISTIWKAVTSLLFLCTRQSLAGVDAVTDPPPRRIRVQGHCDSTRDGIYEQYGMAANGAMVYASAMDYLYFDKDCSGRGIARPLWVIDRKKQLPEEKPNLGREFDLSGDGTCIVGALTTFDVSSNINTILGENLWEQLCLGFMQFRGLMIIAVSDPGVATTKLRPSNDCKNEKRCEASPSCKDSIYSAIMPLGTICQVQDWVTTQCYDFDGYGLGSCKVRPATLSTSSPIISRPTWIPTRYPTHVSTNSPILSPTAYLITSSPIRHPSHIPTQSPATSPTQRPSRPPTRFPSNIPTQSPATPPTQWPSRPPTRFPSHIPTQSPTTSPTQRPSRPPIRFPSHISTQSSTTFSTQPPTRVLSDMATQRSTSRVSPLNVSSSFFHDGGSRLGFGAIFGIAGGVILMVKDDDNVVIHAIDRQVAEALLASERNIGTYLFRESSNMPGGLVLSVLVGDNVFEHHILTRDLMTGYFLINNVSLGKPCRTLEDLVKVLMDDEDAVSVKLMMPCAEIIKDVDVVRCRFDDENINSKTGLRTHEETMETEADVIYETSHLRYESINDDTTDVHTYMEPVMENPLHDSSNAIFYNVFPTPREKFPLGLFSKEEQAENEAQLAFVHMGSDLYDMDNGGLREDSAGKEIKAENNLEEIGDMIGKNNNTCFAVPDRSSNIDRSLGNGDFSDLDL
eukprot:UC4_evm2s1044